MSPSVHREGGRVWIEDVPNSDMTRDWARLAGLGAMLTHRGETVSLHDLLAHSGDAFHLCHATKWELRLDLSMPTDPLTNAARACGYACAWTEPRWFHELIGLQPEERRSISRQFAEGLWREIDAGRPVLLGGTHGECASWRVVVGYDRDREMICYNGGETPYEWTELHDPKVQELGFWDAQVRGTVRPGFCGGWQANVAFVLGEKTSDPSSQQKALAPLRRAVELFHAPEFQTSAYGGVTYYFGERAYKAWADELRRLDYPADLGKPRPPGDWYDMSHLPGQAKTCAEIRTVAADFCDRGAQDLPNAKPHLARAADAYRHEAGICRGAFAALLYGTDAEREAWLSGRANRDVGADAILQMLEQERIAIASIEAALGQPAEATADRVS